jgi:hypothetical protein
MLQNSGQPFHVRLSIESLHILLQALATRTGPRTRSAGRNVFKMLAARVYARRSTSHLASYMQQTTTQTSSRHSHIKQHCWRHTSNVTEGFASESGNGHTAVKVDG